LTELDERAEESAEPARAQPGRMRFQVLPSAAGKPFASAGRVDGANPTRTVATTVGKLAPISAA
jgi:hypothetical protein